MKATTLTACALSLAILATSPGAGIPVIDVSNLAENTQTALKSIASYAQAVQAYRTQVLQYANMIENTTGLAQVMQIWQQAKATEQSILGATGVFQNGGQLMNTVNQFKDLNYWLDQPYAGYQLQPQGNMNQTTSNKAMIEQIQAQQNQIQTDAANLEMLQRSASTTDGVKQALDAANELSAHMGQQLLSMRSFMITEQQVASAKNTTQANDQAKVEAASHQFFTGNLTIPAGGGWRP